MAKKNGCMKWGLGCVGLVVFLIAVGAALVVVNKDAIVESDFYQGFKEGYEEQKEVFEDARQVAMGISETFGAEVSMSLNVGTSGTVVGFVFQNQEIFSGLSDQEVKNKCIEIATYARNHMKFIERVDQISIKIENKKGGAVSLSTAKSYSWTLEELGGMPQGVEPETTSTPAEPSQE